MDKTEMIQSVENLTKDLSKLNRHIYENPELPFHEHLAAEAQINLLKKHDFSIIFPAGNLQTAFVATFSNNSSKSSDSESPTVAFLSEYDALPELGHACGHNLIATTSVGAAITLSKFADEFQGTIKVIGTPAEEGGGGKVHLLNEGIFDDVDFAMMMHPGPKNMIGRGGLACTTATIEANGQSAHSAAPHKGINALSAIINIFNEIDTLKADSKESNKINGIITHGGTASNVIPDYSRALFTIRSATSEDLQVLIKRVKDICRGAELLTNAQVNFQHSMIYTERYPNSIMGEQFKSHMENLGEEVNYPTPNEILGSSDIGNVSKTIPTIHPYIKIAETPAGGHTKEFLHQAGEQVAEDQALQSAKGLAMTGFDLLTDEQFRNRVLTEFLSTIPGEL